MTPLPYPSPHPVPGNECSGAGATPPLEPAEVHVLTFGTSISTFSSTFVKIYLTLANFQPDMVPAAEKADDEVVTAQHKPIDAEESVNRKTNAHS